MWPLLALALLASPPDGTVRIASPHYGATVAVDRRPVGHVPLPELSLAPGLHLVELLRDGRPVFAQVVFVAPGQMLTVPIALPEAPLRPTDVPLAKGAAPAPRYDLQATLALQGARRGHTTDLDLMHRWRLSARDMPAPRWRGALQVTGRHDLAGDGDELIDAARAEAQTGLRVDEAWIGQGAATGFVVGRQMANGPGGRAFHFDGGTLRAPLGEHGGAELRLGRRAAALGPNPTVPWLAGLGLRAEGSVLEGGVAALFHDRWHVDAHAQGRWRALRMTLRARAVDEVLADANARVDVHFSDGDVWLAAGRRARASGPFEWQWSAPDLTTAVDPSAWSVTGGAAWLLATCSVAAQATW
ncbi:MAG: PEGA domain-containing protein, partial [Myxococcales bacterium]|nr:PEGA domain-containing protein [Myxococcales bacterium]